MMAAMNVTSRNKAMMSSTLANYIPYAHFSGFGLGQCPFASGL